MNNTVQEISALTMRWVRRLSRERFSMLFTLMQPMIFWLIFFGSLFERAATTAALKFKYKPRVVDGVPVAVPGVKTRITFRLED